MVHYRYKHNNSTASPSYTKGYTYDRHGNITSINTYQYGKRSNDVTPPDFLFLDYSINPGTTVMIYNGGLFYDDIYELAIGENPNLYFQYYNTVIGYEYENVDTYLVSDTLNVNVPGYYYREYVADEPNSGLYLIFRIIFKVGTPGDFNLIQLNYDQNWLDKLASYDIILYGTSKNVSITYDNQGNPITIHNFKYKGNYYSSANLEWDGRELREIEIPSANITIKYLYDDQGYRINKTIINGSQVQSIDYTLSQGKVIYETDGTYSIIYTYDYDGTLISFNYDNNIHDSITGKDYFYVRNLQGDITAIVNHTGNIVAEYKYDAWGNIIYSTDNEIARINPYTYRGYGYDIETGLFWLSSRYYSPELCRFISPDSVDYLEPESINGLNLYAYAKNNPVMYYDPSGHSAILVIGLLVGSFIVGAGASVVSQGLTYGWDEINYWQAGIDGLFALGSTALAMTGIGALASAGIGAVAGWSQYAIGSAFHGEDLTLLGSLTATGLGFIGGAISGAGARNSAKIASSMKLTGKGASAVKAITTASNRYLAGEISMKGLQATTRLWGNVALNAVQDAIAPTIRRLMINGAITIAGVTIGTAAVNYGLSYVY